MEERESYHNRGFGLSASVYMNRFSITGYGEYSFGYGNVDWWGERFNNYIY